MKTNDLLLLGALAAAAYYLTKDKEVTEPEVLTDDTIDLDSSEDQIYGCMNPNDSNYNSLATVEDGSCTTTATSDYPYPLIATPIVNESCDSLSLEIGDWVGIKAAYPEGSIGVRVVLYGETQDSYSTITLIAEVSEDGVAVVNGLDQQQLNYDGEFTVEVYDLNTEEKLLDVDENADLSCVFDFSGGRKRNSQSDNDEPDGLNSGNVFRGATSTSTFS